MLDLHQLATVDWARAQFALTAMYHFLFVPLTLGLSFLVAILETLYYRSGNPFWLKTTRFWMTLFGINFAIGVATGLIMEFEFGTNWARYSWVVGDIFGAPLAIEGLLAFFLEATFFAVMFFGWNRVSKRFHLVSTWMVAIGSNLSALWILVANGWMQYPVGTRFNLDQARHEMTNFLDVILSPVAISKFIHTVSSGYVISALFMMGISAWYLLKKREIDFAKKSIIVAASFGLISSLGVLATGDHGAHYVAQTQPVKLAAMEGLYQGTERAGLTVFGVLDHTKKLRDGKPAYSLEIQVPALLSFLSYRDFNAYVPGLEDLVYGNPERSVMGADEKIHRGKQAMQALLDYKEAKKRKDETAASIARSAFEANSAYLGYAYLNKAEDIMPPVPLIVHSFHLMVALGTYFVGLFALIILLARLGRLETYRPLLWLTVLTIPLGYLASELGWIVAEVGRQPWVIQDILPTAVGATDLSAASIQTTFWLFLILFTGLLIAEVRIMLKQISIGPEGAHHA